MDGPVDLPFELPEIRVGVSLSLLTDDLFLPDAQCGGATVEVDREGTLQRVVHAEFCWRPIQDHERDAVLDDGADWLLEFDVSPRPPCTTSACGSDFG
jgi:hypothetical protein